MSTPDTLDLRIESIRRGPRFRKDYGGLEKLIESIRTTRLLQPIGVDPENRLIFGERRIRAFESLACATIPARVIPINGLLDGEYAENMVRKDFTVSERVAIGQAMAERLGERRGGDTSTGEQRKPENFPECKGQETRDLAAEHAGFGNGKTYEEARDVVETGIPELVKLMDDEAVAINPAASIAAMPPELQRKVVEKIEEGIRPVEAVRQARNEMQGPLVFPPGKYPVHYIDPPWKNMAIPAA